MTAKGRFGPLIGAIDEGTSSTRFLVFAASNAEILTYHQIAVPRIEPCEGWVEQDPAFILSAVFETIEVTCDNLRKLDIDPRDIVAIGITNQRETTVVWDSTNGKPLYNALVWLDVRTSSTVDQILAKERRGKNFLKPLCGLPISTYFSSLKLRWLIDNVPEVSKAIDEDRCLFGTIDSWLIWNLTGGPRGGLHITDVTNASRTMLMNIATLQWDPQLCKIFGVPSKILPAIRSSSEIYGYITHPALSGVPISGCLGDQQAALVGQTCFQQGQAKSTYGTGCFLLYNTGTVRVQSNHGLLTTVAYKLGPDKPAHYALEGSVAVAGVALQWLRDNLGLLNDVSESAEAARSVNEVGEVYFVPAFSGLYAPYWRKDARGVICGLTENTRPEHLVRAALEAVAFQTRDILQAMALDCCCPLSRLLVDGGMTANNFLMQIQADYCGIPVVRPLMAETTSLGAAMAAGNARGIDVWNLDDVQPVPSDQFVPSITENQKDVKYAGWKMAIARSLDWAEDTGDDHNDDDEGHFLALRPKSAISRELYVTSPSFSPSSSDCRMQVMVYQRAMQGASLRIIAETINSTQWLVNEIPGDDSRSWIKYDKIVGKITQDFQIILEVVPTRPADKGALVGFDNIKLLDCFPETDLINSCTPYQYQCSQTNVCINNTRVCDIIHDCKYGDDESQNCEKIPEGARCNFEHNDWCGWHNVQGKALKWSQHSGSTPTNRTGPSFDHTYGNASGKYLYVNMAAATKEMGFATSATLNSMVFNPPPRVHGNESSRYYNSCTIRFYLHQYGTHKSGLMLQVTELRPKENVTTEMLWSYNDYGDQWVRKIVILPNITHRYYLHFDARKGIRYMGDIAIDDFSMSPECFGLNIPQSELKSYSYWNPDIEHPSTKLPHKDFANETYYEFTNCNSHGRYGPSQENCTQAYKNMITQVRVLHAPGLNGIQKWTVPSDGYYTIIAFGASGGKGSGGMGTSRGAMVRTVVELRKGQELFVLVGQEGSSACLKILGQESNSSCKSLHFHDTRNLTGVRGVLHMEVADGGGGGGGGSFIFTYNRTRQPVPLAIAAGGGGLGLGRFVDTQSQHGQAINMSRQPVGGQMYGQMSAGAGGGWGSLSWQMAMDRMGLMGMPLVQGGIGGQACYNSSDGRGDGGFGGGGGGCTAGGGGGGWAGGNAWSTNTTNGEGGYSYLDLTGTIPSLSVARSGYHVGPGSVVIIPAVEGCGCNFRCVALDVKKSQVTCICPPMEWKLDVDGKSCIKTSDSYPDWLIVLVVFTLIAIIVVFGCVCLTLYNRYQHRTTGNTEQKTTSESDVPLDRLRVTEYNPNYEFAGTVYSMSDLKRIPRDQLQLQKALGQGAFGEVYQGFYRQRSNDTVELPVAVKTLPPISLADAETDFLMEALIMAQFNHPNIIHFIGVCFDKHPRFIVIELLAGGDLKNFLRESRPKPDKNSSLTMRDLVNISIDVAKGCEYMESHRFIHRDIAARNCLLTTKGPGRVVKIADFGMSRDIYRSDYYRKGGRAMLPIKWMPPEAFLDGIFTSKTDIWSFGVLLWEIMSMGYMPYTGLTNREVMELVTNGGRLEPPTNCPSPMHGIMTQCWQMDPFHRPCFTTILERLGYCQQDPEVMNSPLPIFTRPPSQEREQTVMRPPTNNSIVNSQQSCGETSSNVTDYLVPNGTASSGTTLVLGSTSSVDKLLPDNSDSWETSFVVPQSKSTQPLIPEMVEPTDSMMTTAPVSLTAMDLDNFLLHPEITSHVKPIDKISPISLPPMNSSGGTMNVVGSQHANASSLRAGISLDAAALAKSISPTHKSVLDKDKSVIANGVLQNGPSCLIKDNYLVTPGSAASMSPGVSC